MRWLKLLALGLGGLLLLVVMIGALWLGLRIVLHQQVDNAAHLQAKRDYLSDIADLPQEVYRPNILFILFDDLGYGDLGATGSRAIATPTLDLLARDGLVLDNFYSPAPVCTPARAGYLTGRLPLRAGMPQVIMPSDSVYGIASRAMGHNQRLSEEEITLADVLGAAGYATGLVGKWHLGDRAPSLPNDMGFDFFYGSLYSNDMQPFALYRDRNIEIEAPADQRRLNEWYGAEARAFIERNTQQPFFLLLAHHFPHIPLSVPKADAGRSSAGLYGDVVEGLDDLVESLVKTLQAQGIEDNTIILVTSDNGPWYEGSRGSMRGRKGETFEGGMRVPMIVHWPAGFLGGRVLDGISMGTDWFPTILDLLALPLPGDRIVDGRSLRGMLQRGEPSPNQYLYYFAVEDLLAVRDQHYKYHPRRSVPYNLADSIVSPGVPMGPWLFRLDADPGESYDLSMRDEETAQRFARVVEEKISEMQRNMRGWIE